VRRIFLAASTAVLIAGLVLLGLWIRRHSGPAPDSSSAAAVAPPAAEPLASEPAEVESTDRPPAEPGGNAVIAASPDPLASILDSAEPVETKAERLLTLLPNTEPARQAEVAGHLVNLLGDEQFLRVGPMLTNTATPEPVLTLLMNELLNRAEAVKLPLAVSVASVENHPLQGDALNLLKVFLGEDYGTNWAAWREAVRARLESE
jgi:hypothetical protein